MLKLINKTQKYIHKWSANAVTLKCKKKHKQFNLAKNGAKLSHNVSKYMLTFTDQATKPNIL